MKVLAVGDIHTKLWIIEEVFKHVDEYDHIVFCGDYADNWNTSASKSLETWRLLRLFMTTHPDKVHAVIGNHDYAYLHSQIAGHSSGFNNITYQLINAPENRKLKNWLLGLPVTFELDGVTFSHAGVTEEWDGGLDIASIWDDQSPIWARPQKWDPRTVYKNIPQVIGHNASETIWQPQANVYCIDTFSEDQNNHPIGDHTVLEIIDGKEFKIKKLVEYENNSNPTSVEDKVS